MNDRLSDDNITLEELLKRPDIALISDEISSGEELAEQLMKYLKLPRRDRRYSDYYSLKFRVQRC